MKELFDRLIELDKMKTEYKKLMEEYSNVVLEIVKAKGVGVHFQDSEGTVYQIEECSGKYVYFDKFEVNRTKRQGEAKGSLSVTKAKELGYNL